MDDLIEERRMLRLCLRCGVSVRHKRANSVYCSNRCRVAGMRNGTPRESVDSPRPIPARDHASSARSERRAKLFERDGWTCHLCGKPVDPKARYPDSWSPVLDHLVPKSLGGSSDADNLRTAHALCNNQRKAMSVEMFALKSAAARPAGKSAR